VAGEKYRKDNIAVTFIYQLDNNRDVENTGEAQELKERII